MKEVGVGLIGAGTVGGGVVKILNEKTEHLRTGQEVDIRLRVIADKDSSRLASLPPGNARCVTDAREVLDDPSVSVVVELVGGTTFARELVLGALSRGKHVVTANKALLAEHGPEIFETAARFGVSLYFEASVGGGMPVIKTIREGLVANEILSIKTIINGTCNYILSRMTAEGLPFDRVLKQAQKMGYAEADPTLDVEGGDSGHKVAILASLICDGYVSYSDIAREGITKIGREDIAYAKELGYTIKLLGVIKRDASEVDVRVHPVMLHHGHILASVNDVYNAVLIEGDAVGRILLYGRGAGEFPTASAVVSDIVDLARNIDGGTSVRLPVNCYSRGRRIPLKPPDSIVSRYYLRFTVKDRPGVLANITSYLGNEGISIASVIQKEGSVEGSVPVILLTHSALERGVRTAVSEIEKMKYVRSATQVIRIEE